MSEGEILIRNREACEKTLKYWAPHIGTKLQPLRSDNLLEPLRSEKLNETPFEITEALLWAYRRIEALQSALTQAISQGCTCDHLYGATCNIHRLAIPAGIQEAVAHLKALEEAARFTKEFLLKLEGPDASDPLRSIRQHFHKPLHAKLDAALKGVRNA